MVKLTPSFVLKNYRSCLLEQSLCVESELKIFNFVRQSWMTKLGVNFEEQCWNFWVKLIRRYMVQPTNAQMPQQRWPSIMFNGWLQRKKALASWQCWQWEWVIFLMRWGENAWEVVEDNKEHILHTTSWRMIDKNSAKSAILASNFRSSSHQDLALFSKCTSVSRQGAL